jgi:hypothetical protein
LSIGDAGIDDEIREEFGYAGFSDWVKQGSETRLGIKLPSYFDELKDVEIKLEADPKFDNKF